MAKYLRTPREEPLDMPKQADLNEQIEEYSAEEIDGGQTLKKLREEKGMSQAEIARKVALEESTIDAMEKGIKPIPISFAKKFGEIFNVNFNNFLI